MLDNGIYKFMLHMLWHHYGRIWQGICCQDCISQHRDTWKKSWKLHFLTWWPWPLTCDVVTSCHGIMWCRDVTCVTSWCHVTSWHCTICQGISSINLKNTGNYVFEPGDLDLWPMTFIIEFFQNIIKVNPCTKFRDHTSNRSAVRALTDRQTHRRTGPFL